MPAKKWLGIFAVVCLLVVSAAAWAADTDDDDGISPLKLTMDQTRLVHLDESAASVIVANPEHVSVTLDNPRLLILTPHEAGATSMIVLDANGKTILEQDIIISNVQKQYVRIKRICGGSDAGCVEKSYAYCPTGDGCYDVTPVADQGGGTVPPPTAPKGLIGGEPAETLIGPSDDCPAGYNKSAVPGLKGDNHYTCVRR